MSIGYQGLQLQKLLVGATRTLIDGLTQNAITVSPAGDVGAVTPGINGGGMLESWVNDAHTITIEVHQTSTAIDTLYELTDSVRVFPIFYELARHTIEAFAIVQNWGDVSGAVGTSSRTITLGIIRQTGGKTGTGTILQS
jgi:hypothetical protein